MDIEKRIAIDLQLVAGATVTVQHVRSLGGLDLKILNPERVRIDPRTTASRAVVSSVTKLAGGWWGVNYRAAMTVNGSKHDVLIDGPEYHSVEAPTYPEWWDEAVRQGGSAGKNKKVIKARSPRKKRS